MSQTVRVTAVATLAIDHPTRVHGVMYTNPGGQGTLELFDGATLKVKLDIPASTDTSEQVDFGDRGIRFYDSVSCSVNNTTIDFNIIYG